MSIKSSQVILAAVPLIVAICIPVFAQSNTEVSSPKGAINAVELSKKPCMAHGGQGGAHARHFAARGGEGRGGHEGRFRHGHRGMFTALKGQYALSDDQMEKLFSLKSSLREQAQPKIADLISTKKKMRDLITEPSIDKGQLLSLENQINSDKSALGNLQLENKLNQLSVLTDQQRQELRREFVKRSVEFSKG